MIGSVKKRVGDNLTRGNSAKERSINRCQSTPFRAVLNEVLKHLVPSLDQLSALADIIMLTAIGLTYRGVW